MTNIPLTGLQFFKKVSAFVPSGQIFVVAIGKDGKGCKKGEKPCVYGVISREQISDMAAVDAISHYIEKQRKPEAPSAEAPECYPSYNEDEALGGAGADE